MTMRDFDRNHIAYKDGMQGRAYVHSLAILNAAPGKESMYMCGLFGLPMSSAMMRGGPDEDYVSFEADKDACSSYSVGGATVSGESITRIYYPDIEDIIDEILGSYPEFAEQMPGVQKQAYDSSELYKSLGMEIQDEES